MNHHVGTGQVRNPYKRLAICGYLRAAWHSRLSDQPLYSNSLIAWVH